MASACKNVPPELTSTVVAIELYSQALISGQVELKPNIFTILAEKQETTIEKMLNSAGTDFINTHLGQSLFSVFFLSA